MHALQPGDVDGIAIDIADPQVAPLMPRLEGRRGPTGHPLLELLPVEVDPRPVQRETFGAQLRHPIGGIAMVAPRAGIAEELLELHALIRFS